MAEDQKQKEVEQREAAKQASVDEYYALSEAAKPTPTQKENDLAKVGALNLDEKEDDGSEWEADAQRRVMEGRLENPYNVRSMEAEGGEGEGGEGRRRGRRPKAAE